jgi:hypothetical protein
MSSGIMRYAREPGGRLSIRLEMFPTGEAIRRLSEMRQAGIISLGDKWAVQVGKTLFQFGRRDDAEFETAAMQGAWLI